MTYYLLDRYDFTDDGLIKIGEEAVTPELKELAHSAARKAGLKDVAVIFFHSGACSVNQMIECGRLFDDF